MANFTDITIVSIDGRNGDCLGAQFAIRRSANQLPGAKQLLLSAEKPKILLEGVTHQTIQSLSYFEYTIFVLYSLWHLIDTEYALIVQEDGWVLDGANWKALFFDYDYIGSPAHLALVTYAGNSQYFRNFQWTRFLDQPGHNIRFVQNGGFSLRSRRFLKAFSELRIPYVLPSPRTLVDEQGVVRVDWSPTDSQNEDVYCCINQREALEGYGLKFAPLDVSKYFGFEHCGVGIHEQMRLDTVLGCHSRLRRLVSKEAYEVAYSLTEKEVLAIYGEEAIVSVLSRQAAQITYKSENISARK